MGLIEEGCSLQRYLLAFLALTEGICGEGTWKIIFLFKEPSGVKHNLTKKVTGRVLPSWVNHFCMDNGYG